MITLTLTLTQSINPNTTPNPQPVCTSGMQVCSLHFTPAFAEILRKEGDQKEKYKKATKVRNVVKTTVDVFSTVYLINGWSPVVDLTRCVVYIQSITSFNVNLYAVAIVTPSRKYSRKAIRLCLQGAAKKHHPTKISLFSE